jgi:hypothetical protein
MKRIITAAFLTAVAGVAFAQQAANPAGKYVIIEEGATPPTGYAPLVPSYQFKDGRFVRNGELFQSLHGGN